MERRRIGRDKAKQLLDKILTFKIEKIKQIKINRKYTDAMHEMIVDDKYNSVASRMIFHNDIDCDCVVSFCDDTLFNITIDTKDFMKRSNKHQAFFDSVEYVCDVLDVEEIYVDVGFIRMISSDENFKKIFRYTDNGTLMFGDIKCNRVGNMENTITFYLDDDVKLKLNMVGEKMNILVSTDVDICEFKQFKYRINDINRMLDYE
jgi:hypothetical protein